MQAYFENSDYKILSKVVGTSQVVVYQGVILFEQYYTNKFHGHKGESVSEAVARDWIRVEIIAYYCYIISAIFYIAYI